MGKGSMAKKIFLKKDPRGQVAANMYSGKKLKATPFVLGGGLIGGLGMLDAGKSLSNQNFENDFTSQLSVGDTIKGFSPKIGSMERGEAASFMADGGSSSPNLGATGDIVLGLHNKRRG